MFRCLPLVGVLISSAILSAVGCAADSPEPLAPEPRLEQLRSATTGTCGIGGTWLASRVLTPASIPSLSVLERSQIILAVRESAHTDVTTIQEAFQRVDGHEINWSVLQNEAYNQFYVEVEYGAGDNSYGAFFYWGTDSIAAAIHDGDQYECGPLVFNYDRGDLAPACAGFLTYVNGAPFSALDAYLPSNVAQAIVDARNVRLFDSVASVVAVPGVADFRLQQLLTAARIDSWVGPTCSGIYDQIGISTAEAAAMVAFVNEANREELRGVLSFLVNETVVDTLRASRPIANALGLSNVSGVGPTVFRFLRNAATFYRPYEELVGAVNALNHPDAQVRLDLHFEWQPLVTGATNFTDMNCFGISPSLLPPGATLRPTLANGNEVVESFAEAVSSADFLGELPIAPHPGYADLERRTLYGSFLGCYISSHPNPWVYDRTTFYVDTQSGRSLLITQHYVE